MRMLPVLICFLLFGVYLERREQLVSQQPGHGYVDDRAKASEFLNYKSAVLAFLNQNSQYVGDISVSQVASFTDYNLSSISGVAGAHVVSVDGGREVEIYASMDSIAVSEAKDLNNGDAALGVSSGNSWTSYIRGSISFPLPIAVNSGDLVYFVSI